MPAAGPVTSIGGGGRDAPVVRGIRTSDHAPASSRHDFDHAQAVGRQLDVDDLL